VEILNSGPSHDRTRRSRTSELEPNHLKARFHGRQALTMIHDSASHRVLKVFELARLIANQLTPASRKSVVNLACACRYLEEPVLSALWETQWSLGFLLKVLPGGIWDFDSNPESGVVRG